DRLVEHQVDLGGGLLQEDAAEGDGVLRRIDVDTRSGYDGTVDRHLAGQDRGVALPAREPGAFGEQLVEPQASLANEVEHLARRLEVPRRHAHEVDARGRRG